MPRLRVSPTSADAKLVKIPQNASDDGSTVSHSHCVYVSRTYGASLEYLRYPTVQQAQSAFVQGRAYFRGSVAIKGSAIVSAYVNDMSSAHLEQKTLSKKFATAMLAAM